MKSIKEVERWTVSVLEALASGKFREDALVELKRRWPDSYKAARRIAGQGNAARGSDILWIIGADERVGLVPEQRPDLASFLPTVWQHFDGPAPQAVHVEVSFSGLTCTALSFDTSRAPYVVKNPEFGSREAVVIEREIPWRDGTRVRSARRDEIIRLLLDSVVAPEVEVFSAEGSLHDDDFPLQLGFVRVRFSIEFYIMPRSADVLIIPHHRVHSVVVAQTDPIPREFHSFQYISEESQLRAVQSALSFRDSQAPIAVSKSLESFEDTGSELLVTRPCHVHCYARVDMPEASWRDSETFKIQITYYAGPDRVPFVVGCVGEKGN